MGNHKWHYFMSHGHEYLVLGYNPDRNNVMCVSLHCLHPGDKEDLLHIVDSAEAQREAYLVAILARHPYAGGGTWWDRLMPHGFFADLTNVERFGVAPDQIKVFRDKFAEKYPNGGVLQGPRTVLSLADTHIMAEGNSTPEPTKTENIDDILFGYVLSEKDREDIAMMKRRAGILNQTQEV
jgi:hypothetical protein